METSPQNHKRKLQIAIIILAALALSAILLFVLIPRKATKPETVVAPKAKPVSKASTISKDPIEWDRDWDDSMRKVYEKEQMRFAKVLNEASDEELFVVLNYAIAQHYVPSLSIDPLHDVYAMVGHWHKSMMVYRKLSDRKDLLKKIYPNLKDLDNYVRWEGAKRPYPETIVSQTILNNVKQESRKMNAKLIARYFRTPLLDRRYYK